VDPLAPNKLLIEAASRNKIRLTQANHEDQTTLGEQPHYFSSDPNFYLPNLVIGPDHTFHPPDWFLRKITMIAADPSPTPTKSSVRFDVLKDAAEHTASLLQGVDYDFQQFLQGQTGSTLDFGSEFCKREQIRPLLRTHPGFDKLAEVLASGMPYRYSREISEDERETEVLAMLAWGTTNPPKTSRQ
jgi:hypothetical protein